MSQQKSAGTYRKIRTIQEGNSISQWESYSRSKQSNSSFRKKPQSEDNEEQWMGNEGSPPRPEQPPNNNYATQSFELKHSTLQSSRTNEQAKAPTQLIQDILKGLALNSKLTTVNPYYS